MGWRYMKQVAATSNEKWAWADMRNQLMELTEQRLD
jgi:hypothetical protein